VIDHHGYCEAAQQRLVFEHAPRRSIGSSHAAELGCPRDERSKLRSSGIAPIARLKLKRAPRTPRVQHEQFIVTSRDDASPDTPCSSLERRAASGGRYRGSGRWTMTPCAIRASGASPAACQTLRRTPGRRPPPMPAGRSRGRRRCGLRVAAPGGGKVTGGASRDERMFVPVTGRAASGHQDRFGRQRSDRLMLLRGESASGR